MNGRKTPERMVMDCVANFFAFDPNVRVIRHNVGAKKFESRWIRFGVKGESDFSGVIRSIRCPVCGRDVAKGVALFIECKSEKGKLSPEQDDFLRDMRRLGAVTFIARPVPTADDPTGFVGLKRELALLSWRYCGPECERRSGEKNVAENWILWET